MLGALLLVLPLLTATAHGQERSPVTALDQLIDELVQNNPNIRAAQFRFEAATKRPSQVSTLPDPKLRLVNLGVGRPLSGFSSDFAYWGIGVSQEIPFPGKLALAGEEAKREANSEREMYRNTVLEKTAELKVAYYEWFFVMKAIQITRKNRDLLDRFEQIARTRYSVGRGIQQDVLRAQVEISAIVQQTEVFEQRKAAAEARIRALLNSERPLGTPSELRQSSVTLDMQRVLQLVEAQSPRLEADRQMVASRAVGIDKARRESRPDFNVSFEWQKTGAAFPDYYMTSVELRIPLYARRKQQLGTEEASARLREARENLQSASQDLVFQAKDLFLSAKTSERLIALYQSGIIPQTAVSLESALAGYEVGSVDFLTLVTNAMSVLTYEMQYYEELTRHEQALAKLEPLVGMELTRP
jgi:outer membrane protein TolC